MPPTTLSLLHYVRQTERRKTYKRQTDKDDGAKKNDSRSPTNRAASAAATLLIAPSEPQES